MKVALNREVNRMPQYNRRPNPAIPVATCPVCDGTGVKKLNFYPYKSTGADTLYTQCRSCSGRGYLLG